MVLIERQNSLYKQHPYTIIKAMLRISRVTQYVKWNDKDNRFAHTLYTLLMFMNVNSASDVCHLR